jgi:hypothetical protein
VGLKSSVWVLLPLMLGCAGRNPRPSHQQQLETAVARLAQVAWSEAEAAPDDAELQWLAWMLGGEQPPLKVMSLEAIMSPLFICMMLEDALDDKQEIVEISEVEELLLLLDQVAPTSSIVPLYRLKALRAQARTHPSLWEHAAAAVEEALRRNDFASPSERFKVWFFGWMRDHESDPFVRASFELKISSSWFTQVIDWAQLVQGAAYATGTPRADVVRVADLLHVLVERRMRDSPYSLDVLIASVAGRILAEARFLLHWRLGHEAEARSCAQDLDRWMHWKVQERAWSPVYLQQHEAELGLTRMATERMKSRLTDAIGKREFSADTLASELREAARSATQDAERVEAAHRRIRQNAGEILRKREEEMNRSRPFLEELERYASDEAPYANALTRALDERPWIQKASWPPDRRDERLDAALLGKSPKDTWGYDVYRWLWVDALVRGADVPEDSIRDRLRRARPWRRLDILAVLMLRGGEVSGEQVEEAIREISQEVYGVNLQGYCLLLAERVRRDPAAAAAMLPDDREYRRVPQGTVTICETLRDATGQDLGLDLARWKAWLADR